MCDLRQPPCQKWSGWVGGGVEGGGGRAGQGPGAQALGGRGSFQKKRPVLEALQEGLLWGQPRPRGRFCTLCLARGAPWDQRVASSSRLFGVCIS